MQRVLLFVDRISAWAGKISSWAIVVLTLVTCYDVAARYLFRAPTDWAFDTSYMLYGTLFMMAGAYTLSRNGHVRGDVLYGFFPPRLQAGFDLILYFLFFVPGVFALAYFGIPFAAEAWRIQEHSSLTPGGPPIYHFKTVIPVAGGLLLLQGLAEIVRCVICLVTGRWPKRLSDVEEVQIDELKEMVASSEAEIQAELRQARKQQEN
jgi:TRAP-type mannitol/chloroaromatic compound transport system permease small subunit